MSDRPTRTGFGRRLLRRIARLLPWPLVGVASCIAPRSFKEVESPRPGRALGGRVAVVYSRHYQIDLGGAERLHSFDIRKYARIYLKLNADGLIRPGDVFVPAPVSPQQVALVHTPAFVRSLQNPMMVARYLEAPQAAMVPPALLDAGVLSAFRHATGGTIEAARLALRYGIAINLGGGYHHAKPDAGEGFCVYNDMAIAVRVLQQDHLVKRVLVVDLDVHQGNGTAVCLGTDPGVFTFDMHEGDIYPVPKARCSRDIDLPAGTGDKAYLQILRENLPVIMDEARPDIVFLQAGADVLAGDPLAYLRMTPDGVVQRDATVIDACALRTIPVVMLLGGGYSRHAWAVQYQSIRRTIRTYGDAHPAHPPRPPTAKEQLYTK